jgi:hypothetical protein
MEKLLFDQLVSHWNAGNILSMFQSAFREGHSTATALTKILDDIHLVVEKDAFSLLLCC